MVVLTVSATDTVSFLSFRSLATSYIIIRTALGGKSDAAIATYLRILISGKLMVHVMFDNRGSPMKGRTSVCCSSLSAIRNVRGQQGKLSRVLHLQCEGKGIENLVSF